MDEKINDLVTESDLRKELLLECVEVIKNSPTNHAYTYYDLSMIETTVKRAVEHFKKHFGL